MNSKGNFVSLVLNFVLSRRNGHTPVHYEHVPCLTLPIHIEGYKVFRIVDVNDSGLVREIPQGDVNASREPEGTVFEVHLYNGGLTRFYYVSTNGKFQLMAQNGNSVETIGEIIRLRREEIIGANKSSTSQTQQLEEWLIDDGENNSLAIANAVVRLLVIPSVERNLAKKLAIAGFDNVEKVANAGKEELAATISGLKTTTAEDTIKQALFVFEKTLSGSLGPNNWSETELSRKPIRVLKLEPLSKLVKQPTRTEKQEMGRCFYCSGVLVQEGTGVICLECGKMDQIGGNANDDWEERARKLRRELRR